MKVGREAARGVSAGMLVLALSACGQVPRSPASATAIPRFNLGARVLDAYHPGYQEPVCAACHPADGHQGEDPSTCASCHGANGACAPRGPSLHRTIRQPDECRACHGRQHQLSLREDCTACHLASAGVVHCTVSDDAKAVSGRRG